MAQYPCSQQNGRENGHQRHRPLDVPLPEDAETNDEGGLAPGHEGSDGNNYD
jgi:hypothetical protein